MLEHAALSDGGNGKGRADQQAGTGDGGDDLAAVGAEETGFVFRVSHGLNSFIWFLSVPRSNREVREQGGKGLIGGAAFHYATMKGSRFSGSSGR